MKRWALAWIVGLVASITPLCLGIVACQGDCESCTRDVPARPEDLKAEIFKSGIHLTWQDVSDNEKNFIIERAARSSATLRFDEVRNLSATPPPPSEVLAFGHHFFEVVELAADTEDYLDTDVDSGMTYFYRIKAVNDTGESTSDEIEVAFP